MSLARMQNLPKIMGNTDPMHIVRLLPGVQTNSECDSGIHIQGCGNAHNEISLGGVPVYGANHLLGLFSVFNPSHYKDMSYSTFSDFNRLGGQIMMVLPDTLQHKASGDISVGLMSSQGTIGLRLGEKSHLRVSARRSYLNLLYKRWLKILDSELKYGFGDYNMTYLFVPNSRNRLWVDLYYGNDDIFLTEEAYDINFSLGWGNRTAGFHWEHTGEILKQRHTIFYSDYVSDVNVDQEDLSVKLPSYIRSFGYRGKYNYLDFKTDIDLIFYDTKPQTPIVTGIANNPDDVQKAVEGSLLFGYEKTLWNRFDLSAWLKGTLYLSPERKLFPDVSPDISLSYDFYRYGKLRFSYGERVQPLFQTGISNVGFPLEFWLMAGEYSRPQKSRSVDLKYEVMLMKDALSVSVGLYGKQLKNQIEYKGDMLDLLLSKYDLHDNILKGQGYNYGMTFMIHKQTGVFTGWVSYSLGRALRRFDDPEYSEIYPANHERIHDLNAVCSYQLSRWNFSGTFVYASGTPFTAPKAFYISSGQVIADYGEHNARRLRPYARLDISVTCRFMKKGRQENGMNLSVYNILCRDNEVGYKLRFNKEGIAFTPDIMPLSFMPSISYYHKF